MVLCKFKHGLQFNAIFGDRENDVRDVSPLGQSEKSDVCRRVLTHDLRPVDCEYDLKILQADSVYNVGIRFLERRRIDCHNRFQSFVASLAANVTVWGGQHRHHKIIPRVSLQNIQGLCLPS